MGRVLRFETVAKRQQAAFRATLSSAARQPTDAKGRRHGHLLAQGHELENLYPTLRGAGGALAFFAARDIKWWTNSRSGDRPVDGTYRGPTRNLASSQVCCVNFLLPLASTPGALTALLQQIDPDVLGVEALVDQAGNQAGNQALVEFEWVGWSEPLEGGTITRGANQTSVDALVVARVPNGRRAYLIEWKYLESYRYPDDKAAGASGQTRRRRYAGLFAHPRSSFSTATALEDHLQEPFYQIMRLLLLRDRTLARGVSPQLPVDEARVLVVCPKANQDYRLAIDGTRLKARFPGRTRVQDLVRTSLKDPSAFAIVSQEALVQGLRSSSIAAQIQPWLAYHRDRYGW